MKHWEAVFRSVNTTGTFVGVLMKDCGNVAVLIKYFTGEILSILCLLYSLCSEQMKNKAGDWFYLYYRVKDEFTRIPITTWNDKW